MRIRIEVSCTGAGGCFRYGDEYEVGTNISRAQAADLLNAGHAVPIRQPIETADDPVHIGNGWYRVKGRKIRGKDAAYAALEG